MRAPSIATKSPRGSSTTSTYSKPQGRFPTRLGAARSCSRLRLLLTYTRPGIAHGALCISAATPFRWDTTTLSSDPGNFRRRTAPKALPWLSMLSCKHIRVMPRLTLSAAHLASRHRRVGSLSTLFRVRTQVPARPFIAAFHQQRELSSSVNCGYCWSEYEIDLFMMVPHSLANRLLHFPPLRAKELLSPGYFQAPRKVFHKSWHHAHIPARNNFKF